jgi:hypothetical protein
MACRDAASGLTPPQIQSQLAVPARVAQAVVANPIDLAQGPWKFDDVVGEPAAWSSEPRLPHTGVRESTRTWTAPGRSITCVVRLEGEGPLATLAVTGQARCQVSAL